MTVPPTFADVVGAAQRIAPHVHRTPVFTSRYMDSQSGAQVFLKAENLQKVGAFKARGAVNAVLSLSESDATRGVLTLVRQSRAGDRLCLCHTRYPSNYCDARSRTSGQS